MGQPAHWIPATKIPCYWFESNEDVSRHVAQIIANAIRQRNAFAVPLSPEDIKRKRTAIFRHQSQKDTALFPGPDDPREFWERAEDRNRHTADLYNSIGLPEYYALEAFVRWQGQAT